MASVDDRWMTIRDGKKVRSDRWGVGKRYRARWREHANGPQKSQMFDRKVDAERFLVGIQHDQLTGRYVDPQLGRTTFDEVCDRYLERRAWRDKTRAVARRSLREARVVFGGRTIASIKRGEVQTFITKLDLAPSTTKVVRQHLSGAFRIAIDDGLIVLNPARDLILPTAEAGAIVPITQDQLDALFAAAGSSWFRGALVLGAGLGLRLSEAAGLTADRVDFLRRTVRVDRQWQQESQSQPGAFAPPKTKASKRTIPVAQEVLDALAAHIKVHGTGGPEGFIVHRDGRPVDMGAWGHGMRRVSASGVKFHDLRHFYASALIADGCSIKAVQSALGHASAAMTLDVYGHLFPGDEDRIRGAIGKVFRTG